MLIICSVEISPATFGGSGVDAGVVDAGVSDAGVDAGLVGSHSHSFISVLYRQHQTNEDANFF